MPIPGLLLAELQAVVDATCRYYDVSFQDLSLHKQREWSDIRAVCVVVMHTLCPSASGRILATMLGQKQYHTSKMLQWYNRRSQVEPDMRRAMETITAMARQEITRIHTERQALLLTHTEHQSEHQSNITLL